MWNFSNYKQVEFFGKITAIKVRVVPSKENNDLRVTKLT